MAKIFAGTDYFAYLCSVQRNEGLTQESLIRFFVAAAFRTVGWRRRKDWTGDFRNIRD